MVDEKALDVVRSLMKNVRIPSHYDRVYKEECTFSYATPLSPGGLYINLNTFHAFSEEHVGLDLQRNNTRLYLHEVWHKIPLSEDDAAKLEAKPEKLAIGGDGGFQTESKKYDVKKEHALVVLPENLRFPLPCMDLPQRIIDCVDAVMAHDSASLQDTVAVWEEERKVSRYAESLPQLDTGRKISSNPADWRCDETGVTENLWLNLSTGFIGSGRQNWDGSGGNGSALRHFEATGRKYPLAVKLGTITAHGADVFSYADDESDMVLDPKLAEHLSHWGINMMQMQKTEKTMAELQIDLNMSFEFDKITESGSALQPLSGPGYVGLHNLGNSCYMNSVVQVLLSLPPLQQRYAAAAATIFASAPPDPATDFATQMAKLGHALTKGDIGAPQVSMETDGPAATNGVEADGPQALSVKPQTFKQLVGHGHPEFSLNRQQDAVEYYQHLLEVMSRAERSAAARLGPAPPPAASTADLFRFELEDRLQCCESGRVSYKRNMTNTLGLDIPLEAATNKEELEDYREREAKRQRLKEAQADAYIGQAAAQGELEATATVAKDTQEAPVIPRVPFAACLERWAAGEVIEGVHSAALGRTAPAARRTRFATFPPYLVLQMRRYYVASDWTPRKLEVLVEVPEGLDLDYLRGRGLQPDEQLQPEGPAGAAAAVPAAAAAPAAVQPDAEIVAQLVGMGFSENGSKRAAVATQNAGVEACMEWVLAHMEDADFNEPLEEAPTAAAGGGTAEPDLSPDLLAMLTSMGFTDQQATAALKSTGGNIERAADWLFSHTDDLDSAVAAVLNPAAPAAAPAGVADGGGSSHLSDGPGQYSLVGFVSHMGSNTACGHYVCHIKKEGRWVIYNDDKVAVSEHPPKDLGYMYLFRRNDVPA